MVGSKVSGTEPTRTHPVQAAETARCSQPNTSGSLSRRIGYRFVEPRLMRTDPGLAAALPYSTSIS
ncbi:hypothetical protein ACRALDRAFT_2038434 [Sodiomyces alcalophilus JCM 7366]|uniref:uncharacterized protein n=1 Tax=Sodiomyces alcalophilus JCM 7366 TaxID=591952 RepID=UPI0039B633AD